MNRFIAILCTACISICLASCVGNKKSQNDEGVIDSKDIKINERSKDDLPGEWIKILDGKYTIEFDSQGYVWIKVSIRKINSFDDYEISSVYAIPLNKRGESIKVNKSHDAIYMGLDKEEKITEGPVGEYTCKFVTDFFEDDEKDDFINNVNGLEIFYSSYKKSDYDDETPIESEDKNLNYENDNEDDSNKDDNTDITSKTHSLSNNWDSLLDSYEKIAVEYEKLAKEMKSGNLNTGSLTEIAMEAAEMQEKFDANESELTPKQTQRLTKIAAKIAQAATNAAQGSQNIQSIDGMNLKDLGL